MIVTLITSLIFSGFTAYYLNLSPRPLFQVLLFLLLSFAGEKLRKENVRKIPVRMLVFSLFLSVAVIAGKHISVTEPYAGLLTDNFITAYSLWDLAALICLTGAFSVLLHAFTGWVLKQPGVLPKNTDCSKLFLSRKQFLLTAGFLFLFWLPYLFAYWPGFCFDDTLSSINQALGLTDLNNHHPVFYTLFIRLCIQLTGGFRTHDLTAALGLYSVLQMLFTAGSLAFMICWVTARCRIRKEWKYILPFIFACSPYVAADSIAMWKDPAFSAAVVVDSVLLAEFAISDTKAGRRAGWQAGYLACSLFILFWRNNGFCAVLGSFAFLLFFWWKAGKADSRRAVLRRTLATTLCAIAVWGIVTVPVYKLFGIGTPKEESAGLMLNQMARVAAYDGNMSDEEAEYLDAILPLENYAGTYRPCCVDLLKWDENFNYSGLSGAQFWKTWLSLMVKNPGLYLEAWELETYGFWAVNQTDINRNTNNISFGSPINRFDGGSLSVGDYSISFGSLPGCDFLRSFLPQDSWSVPLGIINWGILFICLCLTLKKRPALTLALVPQLFIALGLLISTPIYYLPRYEESAQLLLPLYLALLLC